MGELLTCRSYGWAVCAGTHEAMAAMKDSEHGGKSGIQVGQGKGMARGRKGKNGEEENITIYTEAK